MKKVAFLICSNVVGGHEYQALELYADISKHYSTTLFVNSTMNLEHISISKYCVSFRKEKIFRPGNFMQQLKYALKYRSYYNNLFKEYDFIIVSSGAVEAGICMGYALKHKNKYLYVPMFIDRVVLWRSIWGGVYNKLYWGFTFPYAKIITINRIQAELFSRYKPTIVVPNRIRFESYLCEGDSEEMRLYFVGRLEPSKNLKQLIRWLDTFENPFKEFIIVGDGSQRKELESMSQKLNYIKVVFLGWLSMELQGKLFRSTDVYISNSLIEGEPLAIMEANNRHSVVIASDIIGHRSCVHDENRFRDRTSLIHLLKKAYRKELSLFTNASSNEIENSRAEGIRELFL